MHLLPLNLARLAEHVGDGTRYATSAIHVQLLDDNRFLAEATNCKVLVRVTGNCTGPAEDYPRIPAMDNAPNGRCEGLIPAEAWVRAFGSAKKLARKLSKPILKSVAVKIGENEATLGATNLNQAQAETTRLMEGKFPPAGEVIPRSADAPVRIGVDPLMMADCLRTLAEHRSEDGGPVEIEIFGPDGPLAMRVVTSETEATAVVMPIDIGKSRKAWKIKDEPGEGAAAEPDQAAPTGTVVPIGEHEAALKHLQEQLTELQTQLAAVTEQRDALAARVSPDSPPESKPRQSRTPAEPRGDSLIAKAIEALRGGPKTARELAETLGRPTVASTITNLRRAGKIEVVDRGTFRLVGE